MERPETENGLDFFIEAFWALSSCRAVGMSLGPIPWTAAYQYGLAHGLEHDMLILFPRIISRMDEAFLDWTAREMERKSKAKNPPQQAGKRTVERKR